MAKEIEDLNKFGQAGMDNALKVWGEWAKNWQAVSAEMTDYSKRSFEDGTKTFEKLASAKTIEQVMEIQSGYAKRAYDDYMQQMTRLGSMYAGLAKDSAKPFEQFAQVRR
ncbi:MAG: phasin family protein [Hyphomicrobium sp.]